MRRILGIFLLLPAAFGQEGKYPPSLDEVFFPESGGNTLYGLFGRKSFFERQSPVRSDDRGRTWVPLYPFTPGTDQTVFDLAIHPTNPQIVLAATTLEKGGVYRSADGGRTWQKSNEGLPATGTEIIEPIQFAVNDPQVVYLATRTAVYKSVDSGLTWARRGTLPQGVQPGNSISIARHTIVGIQRTSPAKMYAMARNGGMYASSDEGATWTSISAAKTDLTSYGIEIQIESGNSNYVYLQAEADGDSNGRCMSPGGGLWQSQNGGQSWALLRTSGFCNLSPRAFLDLQRPYVHLITSLFGQNYCRSENRGATFVCEDKPGPVGIDPKNGDILFGSSGLRQTSDAGRTWTATGATMAPTLRLPAGVTEYRLEEGSIQTQRIRIATVELTSHRVPLTLSVRGGEWLRVTQTNPQTNTDVTIELASGALPIGEYTAIIRAEAPESNNKNVELPVKMIVRERTPSGLLFLHSRVIGGLSNFSKPIQDDVIAADASAQSCASAFPEANGSVLILCNERVRRIDTGGRVRTVAGTGTRADNANGVPASQAQFNFATGAVSTSDGAIWVADQFNNKFKVIRNGVVTTAVDNTFLVDPSDRFGLLKFSTPKKAFLDADGRPVAMSTLGTVKIPAAGAPQTLFLLPASSATLDPRPSLGGVCIDRQGGYYIVDTANHLIWRFRGAAWTKFAGTGTSGFNGDGLNALEGQLASPTGCATDTEGNVYVADRSNNRIRVIRADGRMYTAAGNGRTSPEAINGATGADAPISSPQDVSIDTQGNLYVATFSSILKLVRQRAPKPAITQGSFVNAASFKEPLGQGSLFSLFGVNIAAEEKSASGSPWPERLGGAQVKVNGTIAPLYYTSTGQVNGQVPFETAAGEATIQVEVNGTFSDAIRARIVPAAPGVLLYNGTRAVAVNDDGQINAENAGAAPDSVLVVYFTGQGPLDTAVATGAAAPTDKLVRPVAPSRVTIGGEPADVPFLGLAPGFVGLGQANVKIPAGLQPGDYPLVLIVGDVESPPATITVSERR